MCKCDPECRTPFCGKGDCQWPEKVGTVAQAITGPEKQPEWEKEFYENFAQPAQECGCSEWDIETGTPDQVREFIRSFALTFLDEIGLEERECICTPTYCNCGAITHNEAKQEIDQQKEAIKKKYGL